MATCDGIRQGPCQGPDAGLNACCDDGGGNILTTLALSSPELVMAYQLLGSTTLETDLSSPDPTLVPGTHDIETTLTLSGAFESSTPYASAFATDEWLLQGTSPHANNVGTETLANTGGNDQAAADSGVLGDYVWEADTDTDKLNASGIVAGNSDGEDVAGFIIFKITSGYTAGRYLFCKSQSGGGNPGWQIYSGGSTLNVRVLDGTNISQVVLAGGTTYFDGNWHWIKFWWDESSKTLYAKSDLDSEDSAGGSITGSLDAGEELSVNCLHSGSGSGFTGEFRVAGTSVGVDAQDYYDEAVSLT